MVWTNPALLTLLSVSHVASAAFQSTPVLGWNSYNQVGCSPTEAGITTQINSLATRGFVTAGYKFFGIDCGWASRDGVRNATSGALKYDATAFPNGILPLANLIRSKGMNLMMYSDAGVRMCDTTVPSPVLGSLGNETADADLFKSLGAEFLKYDNCYVDGASSSNNAPKDARTDFVTRFGTMWTQLQRVGIQGMLVCQWGVPYSASGGLEGPSQWTNSLSTSFRLSDDIAKGWSHVYRIYNQAIHIAKSGLSGPGHIADADLLEAGNSGMTFDEQATHFAMWALLKSSLMISTDVSALSTELVAVLQNADLIAINQDPLVKPIQLVQRWTSDRDLWSGPLANGDVAVLITDLSNAARTLSVSLSALNITSATIKDLWTGTSTTGSSFSKSVAAHGSVVLRLSNVVKSTAAAPAYTYIAANTGTLASGANMQACSGCTSSSKVGNIGGSGGGKVTLSNVRTSQATQNVLFDYINGDVGYMGGTNERSASVSVNGGAAVTVSFPLTGYNWAKDISKAYAVQLSGFSTTATNTITISGVGTAWGPDIDRIAVRA